MAKRGQAKDSSLLAAHVASILRDEAQVEYGERVGEILAQQNLQQHEDEFWRLVSDANLKLQVAERANRNHYPVYRRRIDSFRVRGLELVDEFEKFLGEMNEADSRIIESLYESGKEKELVPLPEVISNAVSGAQQMRSWLSVLEPLAKSKKNNDDRMKNLLIIARWFDKFNPRKGSPLYELVKAFVEITEGEAGDSLIKSIMQKLQSTK